MKKPNMWKQLKDAIERLVTAVEEDSSCSLALPLEALAAIEELKEVLDYFEMEDF